MFRTRLHASSRGVIALVLLLVAALARADEHHALWAVKGKHNTVYLFGSIHLLRASESLPQVAEDAYRDSAKLVMEIDLDDLDALKAQQLTLSLGLLPVGETLSAQLGPELAAKVDAEAKRLGMSLAMLAQFKPWLAAITLTQLNLLKLGLDSQSGVEQRFVGKAAADHKEILGLETIEQQFGLLANLPPKLQNEFLLQTIEEAGDSERELEDMLAAWRTGDAAGLEKLLARGMKEFPELYGPLTVERNRQWMKRLEELLSAEQNYLVIVGALHLVGTDGVLDLLKKKGYKIEQR